jgi:hypothetical protein
LQKPIDVQKNRVTQLRSQRSEINLQGFGNFVLERSTLKVFLVIGMINQWHSACGNGLHQAELIGSRFARGNQKWIP